MNNAVSNMPSSEDANYLKKPLCCANCGELNSPRAESCVMCRASFDVHRDTLPKGAPLVSENVEAIAPAAVELNQRINMWPLVTAGVATFLLMAGLGINHFLNHSGKQGYRVEQPSPAPSIGRISRSDVSAVSYAEQQLAQAASAGDLEKVKKLLQQGATASAISRLGVPALGIAATKGHLEIVRVLLDNGCDVNIRARDRDQAGKLIGGFTALHTASAKGNEAVVKLLLERGANVNLVSARNDTPLNFAATNGKAGTMRLLIEAGADMNYRGYLNATPLIITSSLGHADCVRLLLDKGADTKPRVENGYSALDYAEKKGHPQIAQMLRDAGAR